MNREIKRQYPERQKLETQVNTSIYLSIYLSIYPSIYLSICLYIKAYHLKKENINSTPIEIRNNKLWISFHPIIELFGSPPKKKTTRKPFLDTEYLSLDPSVYQHGSNYPVLALHTTH